MRYDKRTDFPVAVWHKSLATLKRRPNDSTTTAISTDKQKTVRLSETLVKVTTAKGSHQTSSVRNKRKIHFLFLNGISNAMIGWRAIMWLLYSILIGYGVTPTICKGKAKVIHHNITSKHTARSFKRRKSVSNSKKVSLIRKRSLVLPYLRSNFVHISTFVTVDDGRHCENLKFLLLEFLNRTVRVPFFVTATQSVYKISKFVYVWWISCTGLTK